MNIKVIGCGGIGLQLLDPLCRYLNYHPKLQQEPNELTLVDGDQYEERNRERQAFTFYGNKAEITVQRLEREFSQIDFRSFPQYLTEDNIFLAVRDGDVVFMCVDNHSSRKLVSDHCETLDNVVLISGGNDFTDGNVQIHIRKNGENVTLPIANEFHPEIQEPKDKNPAKIKKKRVGCEAKIKEGDPQLLWANNMIAAMMGNAFYSYLEDKLEYDEVYVDIVKNQSKRYDRTASTKESEE